MGWLVRPQLRGAESPVGSAASAIFGSRSVSSNSIPPSALEEVRFLHNFKRHSVETVNLSEVSTLFFTSSIPFSALANQILDARSTQAELPPSLIHAYRLACAESRYIFVRRTPLTPQFAIRTRRT